MKDFIKKNKIAFIVYTCIVILSAILLLIRGRYDIECIPLGCIVEDSPYAEFTKIENGQLIYDNQNKGENGSEFDRRNIYRMSLPNLPMGVYSVETKYQSDYDTSVNNQSVVDIFLSDGRSEACKMAGISLFNWKSINRTLFWVNSIHGSSFFDEEGKENKLVLAVDGSNYGYCKIESVRIRDYTPWKIGVFFIELLVFLAYLFVANYSKFSQAQVRYYFAALIGLTVFCSFPAFNSPYYVRIGHDTWFHLQRIASLASELYKGDFPVFYMPDAKYGYGYVTHIMYGKTLLYFPAILHLLGLPLSNVYDIYVIFINALTVGISFYSFRKMFRDKTWAFIATLIYVLSTYRIYTVYIRTAVGEYTAMAFFPLLVYGIYNLYYGKNKPGLKDGLPLIIAISGIIQSHTLSSFMFIPFLLIFALINIKRTKEIILPVFSTFLLTVLCNLFFIIPFIDIYRSKLNINSKEYAEDILQTGASLSEVFSMFINTTDGSVLDKTAPTAGGTLFIGIMLFIILLFASKDINDSKKMLVVEVFVLGMLAIWLSTIYFPWDFFAGSTNSLAKAFTSVQYVWRYLGIASVCLSIVTAYSLKFIKNNMDKSFLWGINVTGVIIIISFVIAATFFSRLAAEEGKYYIFTESGNLPQDGLYIPKYFNEDITFNNQPYSDNSEVSVWSMGTDEKERRQFYVVSNSGSAEIDLPLIYWDFLEVYDAQLNSRINSFRSSSGKLAFSVPSGYEGMVYVEYKLRPLWIAGYILSAISWILLLGFYKNYLKNKH